MNDRTPKLVWTIAKGVLIALILGVFGWLLVNKLKGMSLRELQAALAAFPAWRIGMALLLLALNYLVLTCYDYLALRYLKHPVKLSQLMFGSIVGYAMSFNFGFLIGGSTVRYRLYSSWGFSNLEIAKLIGTLTVTFWVGVFAVAGLVFVISPLEIPPDVFGDHSWFPIKSTFPLGVGSLVFIAAYLIICGVWHKPLKYGTHEFTPPSLGFSICQILVASLDQIIAAGVFFVLLPGDVRRDLGFLQTVNVYLLFTAVSALLHIPGGLVVLEKIVLDFIHSNNQADLTATLIVYRVIYYLIPLAIAGVLMLVHEWRHRAGPVAKV